jgi:ABC-type multidrug transport system ATPase subunit
MFLALNNIVAFRGKYPVISGITMTISECERVWISGPNGVGKTSLLKVIAGLFAISEGSGEVLDENINNYFLIRQKVGFVGHDHMLYGDLTPIENLSFFAKADDKLKHLSKNAFRKNIVTVLNTLEFPERLYNVRSSGLSEGQKKKLSIAKVVLKSPKLILLDEPHAGLDKNSRTVLDNLILEFTTNSRGTVIFTSHEDQLAEPIATRNIVLKGGTITKDVSLNVS